MRGNSTWGLFRGLRARGRCPWRCGRGSWGRVSFGRHAGIRTAGQFFGDVYFRLYRRALLTALPGSGWPPLSELHPVSKPQDPHEGTGTRSGGKVHRSILRLRAVQDDDEGSEKPERDDRRHVGCSQTRRPDARGRVGRSMLDNVPAGRSTGANLCPNADPQKPSQTPAVRIANERDSSQIRENSRLRIEWIASCRLTFGRGAGSPLWCLGQMGGRPI